ncbi:transcription antitermination factor NusB [Hyphobacterium sp.]|uniref:transcription antitermination factor NusB n=1 Tax=Hyphobacterium sp. TaxID=2004662 RepID=UPI003BAC0C45
MEADDQMIAALKPKPAARLAAIQALFQFEQDERPIAAIIAQFRDHRLGETADAGLFERVAEGTGGALPLIDQQIAGVLSEKWSVDRLDPTLRAILRCGTFELMQSRDYPAGAILRAYVDLAGSFFGDRETAFANGVLDRLAKMLRPQDGAA